LFGDEAEKVFQQGGGDRLKLTDRSFLDCVQHEHAHDQLLFNLQARTVANQRQHVLAVVVEVIFPGVLLNLHLRLSVVHHESIVQLCAQRLELTHRWEQTRSHPCALVRILLARLDGENGKRLFLLIEGRLVFKHNTLIHQRLNVAKQFVFVSLEVQCVTITVSNQDRGELSPVFEGARARCNLIQNVYGAKGLVRKIIHHTFFHLVQ
jgi:hypothetical protein